MTNLRELFDTAVHFSGDASQDALEVVMEQSSDDESSFAEIMRLKRSNRERLILAIQNASPEELEISAQRIKDVLRDPADPSQRRQRIAPPAFVRG